MLKFLSEFEVATGQSTINGQVIALPKGESIIARIILKIGETYAKRPSVCFLDQKDRKTLKDHAAKNDWNTYDSSQLGELINLKKGVLLLDPSEYRGLNTPFGVSSNVEIGCEVKTEAQVHQMYGRANRARGVCEGRVYVNTGEDEASFLRRITVTDYNKAMEYNELLVYLSKLQKETTEPLLLKNGKTHATEVMLKIEVEVLYDEWIQGNYVRSLKELKDLVALKEDSAE